jgi:hypothetical protein
MDIFKERFERYNIRDLDEEKTKRFYKSFTKICADKCMRLKEETFSEKEKECFKSCSVKIFKHYLPLYETFL